MINNSSRPIRELEAEITQLAGHINATNHRFLTLLGEFDNRNGWSDWATQSCAHWLNWKCGIAMRAAREKVRVAHALAKLPRISAAMEKGELSYSKVRELTRVASEATEEALLMTARHGTAQHVETLVRHFRRCKEAEELSREALQQANRFLSYHYEDDGSLVLKARLPAEAGAVILKALDVAIEELPKEEPERSEVSDGLSRDSLSSASFVAADGPAGPPTVKSTLRMKRADALGLMAESFLQHGAEAMNGGDKYQIVVHVAEETLKNKEAGTCEFEDGASIAAETARRCACDASIVEIIEDEDGDLLNVGRKTRSIPPALKRALNSRDKGCRFPGCCNKKYVDGHHVQHWANGGETKLSNLVTFCRFHHHLVHEDGWNVQVLDDGAFRFLKPNGEALNSSCAQHGSLSCSSQPLILSLSKDALHPSRPAEWNGDSMDYHLGVQVLMQQERKDRGVPVEVMSDCVFETPFPHSGTACCPSPFLPTSEVTFSSTWIQPVSSMIL
jgi:hypothetical protein